MGDAVSKTDFPGYKATVQGWWGGAGGGEFRRCPGRGLAWTTMVLCLDQFRIDCLTLLLFLGTRPLQPSFLRSFSFKR